jgi:hypothetical protein
MSIIAVVPDPFQSQHVTTIYVVGAVGHFSCWLLPSSGSVSFGHSEAGLAHAAGSLSFIRHSCGTRLVVTVLIAICVDLPAPK